LTAVHFIKQQTFNLPAGTAVRCPHKSILEAGSQVELVQFTH